MTGFTIPNTPDSGKSSTDQSEPDKGDFEILGDRRRGVVFTSGSPLAVTQSSGMQVNVAAGEVFLQGYFYALSSATPSIGTASGAARFDLVAVRITNPGSSGTAAVTIIPGSPDGTNPRFPSVTDNDVVLAAVYVAGGVSSITSNDIVDKRTFIMSSMVRRGAGDPTSGIGNLGDFYINTTETTTAGQSQLWIKTGVGATQWENISEYKSDYNFVKTTVSTNTPSGGTNGDIWVKVV